MFLYKFWKWQPGISKAERWNATALWKALPRFFLVCFHLYPGWSWRSVGSGRTGKVSHQIFLSLPFPLLSLFLFIFYHFLLLWPGLKSGITNIWLRVCNCKRHHTAPSENALSAQTVFGSCVWGTALLAGSAAAILSVSPLPAPKVRKRGWFALCCPLFQWAGPHSRDEAFFPSALLASTLMAVLAILLDWFIASQNCTDSFSFSAIVFSSLWQNLLPTAFLSYCDLIFPASSIENFRPCFFQNTHINAIRTPQTLTPTQWLQKMKDFILCGRKKKFCHFHLIVSQPNPVMWENTLALK